MATAKAAEGTQFSIHTIGEVTGKLWVGDFRAKPLLSFREKLASDRMRRELLGEGAGASVEAYTTATVIADLTVRLTETPEWWKETKGGLDLQDFNVLTEIYQAAVDIEKGHVKKVEAEGKAAQAALRADTEKK